MLSRWALLAILSAPLAFAQSRELPSAESLSYRVEWRLITAGRARLDWSAVTYPVPGWQASLRLESSGFVSKLFKVQDEYVANLNADLFIVSSHLTTNEGNRHRETNITFDYAARRAAYHERDRNRNASVSSHEIDLPGGVHDMVGGLYYLRTLDLQPGQSATTPVSDGKKVAQARVEAQQREQITVPAGRFRTIRYEIFVFNNVLYRRPAHLYVWLTDDRRKLPVQIRVRMQITIGTITLELEKPPGEPGEVSTSATDLRKDRETPRELRP